MYSLLQQELNKKQNKFFQHQYQHSLSQIDDRWKQLKILEKNIMPRSSHISAIYKNILYVYGGYNIQDGILSDFLQLDLNGTNQGFLWIRNSQKVKNYPGKLKNHSGIVHNSKLILFGGQTKTNQNTNIAYMFELEKKNWDKVLPNIQLPKLDSHSSFIQNGKMYVYGGFCDIKAQYSNSIYEFDIETKKWSIYHKPKKIEEAPSGRGNFGLVSYQGYVWIFGGTNSDHHTLDDMWRFNLKQKYWQRLLLNQNLPQPRRSHSMILHQNHFYIFGGIQEVTKQKNDIYIYSPIHNEWQIIQNSSNQIYQCSPTYKLQKQSKIKKPDGNHKSSRKVSINNVVQLNLERQICHTYIFNNQIILNNLEKSKNYFDQNRQKRILQRKNQMLKQFSQIPMVEIQNIRKLSPTSENMLQAIKIIGTQQQPKKYHKKIQYDSNNKYLVGKKPCARDAHTALIYKDQMLIMGGDRHLMSFSDIYCFDLVKGISTRRSQKKI